MSIAENVDRVRARIESAAQRAGVAAANITLMAVSKTQSSGALREAAAAGVMVFGANYVREGVTQQTDLASNLVEWHLIGHLQSNKSKLATEAFSCIQSVDRVEIAQKIGHYAADFDTVRRVLLEVHLGNEETKAGADPAAALDIAAEIAAIPHIQLSGMMGIAPFGCDPRPFFSELYNLYRRLPSSQQLVLSMGMTADFDAAIEEGSTMIRIGAAIFGARKR